MRISDWSSDVCSSDLLHGFGRSDRPRQERQPGRGLVLRLGLDPSTGLQRLVARLLPRTEGLPMTEILANPAGPESAVQPPRSPDTEAGKSPWTRRMESTGEFVEFALSTFRQIPAAIRLYPDAKLGTASCRERVCHEG